MTLGTLFGRPVASTTLVVLHDTVFSAIHSVDTALDQKNNEDSLPSSHPTTVEARTPAFEYKYHCE